MSLKPGDKAIVVYSGYDINLGKIVEILRPQSVDDASYISDTQGVNFWYVHCEDYFYTSTVDEQVFWVDEYLVMPECCLQKIEEESIRKYPNVDSNLVYIDKPWPFYIKEEAGSSQVLCALEWAWSPVNNRIQS